MEGTRHAVVNPRLDRASEATQHAPEAAHCAGRKLPKEELKATEDAVLTLAPVVEAAPAPMVASDFETLQRQ